MKKGLAAALVTLSSAQYYDATTAAKQQVRKTRTCIGDFRRAMWKMSSRQRKSFMKGMPSHQTAMGFVDSETQKS